jgi:uncharacterized protein YndB with AHSA1/START domain
MQRQYALMIQATPTALWAASTTPGQTRQYWYGTAVQAEWVAGGTWVMVGASGHALDGAVLEVVPEQRLVHTFVATHDPVCRHDAPSRVTWTIEPHGASCLLTVVHDQFEGETATWAVVGPGWVPVLKTLLETGRPLDWARP